jgi:hypothetical protein
MKKKESHEHYRDRVQGKIFVPGIANPLIWDYSFDNFISLIKPRVLEYASYIDIWVSDNECFVDRNIRLSFESKLLMQLNEINAFGYYRKYGKSTWLGRFQNNSCYVNAETFRSTNPFLEVLELIGQES